MNIKISSINFIGVKEFRKNISKYVKQAQKSDSRFVVTSRNEPLFEITPIADSIYKEEFLKGLEKALDDVKKGRVYTHEEILKEFTK